MCAEHCDRIVRHGVEAIVDPLPEDDDAAVQRALGMIVVDGPGRCRLCGDTVTNLDEHLRRHERAAEDDEDARGGAPRP
jgi:hypothetical protein